MLRPSDVWNDTPVDAPGGRFRERPIEPKATALLSIDMQNMECGAPLRARARDPADPLAAKAAFFERIETVVIPNQRRLLAAARAHGIEVVFTTIESLTADGRDRSLDHKISGIHAAPGSWDGRVIDEVAPSGDEIVIHKTASGVFASTNLHYVLRNLGVRYLVLFGVVTEQCVESAIREAADLGYLVTQVDDACASEHADRHDASVAAMDGHYCRRRSTDQMIAEFAATAPAAADAGDAGS